MKFFFSALLFFIIALCVHAQQKRIYIANDDHTDYLWSADENTYRQAFVNMLDFYIGKADSTIAVRLPSDLQSRFNCDGSFWVWTYEQNKTPAEVNTLIKKIKSGHISVPFNAVNSCYGGMPAEAVIRGMYYAGSLERRFNLDIDLALAMEHATLPLGLASLWAGVGAKYSWKGICACNTPFGRGNPSTRNKEMYWYTGLDDKKILMKWYSLNDTIPPGGVDKNQSLGGYSEARNPLYAITACQKKFNTPNFKSFRVAGAFGYGWDDIQTYNSDDFINAAKAKTDESYRVIISNELDFFTDFENTYGNSLPSLTQSFGNERDLLCASLAETSAKVKRSLEKLRSAEAMATLVTPYNSRFGTTLDSARIKAWMGYGLYWEHDWSVFGGVATSSERAAWERKIEQQVSSYTNALFDSASIELGKQIMKTGSNENFFVFNPLSWSRTDYADYLYTGPDNISVVDITTNLQVPIQVIVKNGIRYLRILATNVPSVGYKVFEIRPGKENSFKSAATVSQDNTVIENGLYRITINKSGAIVSMVDKKNKDRECIGHEKANDLGRGSDHGIITIENSGPVSVTLKAVSPNPLSHTSRITLYNDVSRVDIDNQISENFKDVRKWKFTFNLKSPETWHEEVGAIIKTKIVSKGGHYASRNALYKYLTLNHFASVNEKNYGVTLSNRDCYFVQLGNSTHTSLDETSNTLNVLAGGRVSNPELGIHNQDGDSDFNQSFALSTHTAFSKVSEMKFALEHQNPFVTGTITGTHGTYPRSYYSYLKIEDPNVLLWSIKPAEDGYANRGIIIRVWNLGNDASARIIRFNNKIIEAYETSLVETDIKTNSFSDANLNTKIAAQEMSTYRTKFSSSLPVGNMNRNKIVTLTDSVKQFDLEGFSRSATPIIKEGGSYGDMIGFIWMKDAKGQYLVTPEGNPDVKAGKPLSSITTGDLQPIGNFNPDATLGLTNTLSYKRISLRVLVDGRIGGVVVDGTEQLMAFNGIPEVTAQFREGGWDLGGVDVNGAPVKATITAQDYWTTVTGGRYGSAEFFAYDATNFRIREASLGYDIPLSSSFLIKSAKLSVVARNLLWLYRGSSTLDVPGIGKRKMSFDPDMTLGNGNWQGISYGTFPSTRSIGLNLQLTF